MKWIKDAKERIVVASGNGQGEQLNQLHYPRGLSLNRQGHLYVVDCGNHRIQLFENQ